MSISLNKCQSGDTIIEVILAIAIFSLVAVGGLSIMNKGNASAQRSLEITLVRNQIDAQAEILRFWNSSYIAAYVNGASIDSYGAPLVAPPTPAKPAWNWADLSEQTKSGGPLYNSSASGFDLIAGAITCPDPTTAPHNVFIIDTAGMTVRELVSSGPTQSFFQAETISKVKFTGAIFSGSDGLWVEAVRSVDGVGSQSGTGYIDFHIYACWSSIGQEVPMTLGTIVRLYEPR